MKNILVLLHKDRAQEARLRVAIDATRLVSGHLICLDVVIRPEWGDESITRWGLGALLQMARRDEASNVSTIATRLTAEDIAFEILEIAGQPGRQVSKAVGFADLVVVTSDAPRQDLKHARRMAAEIIVSGNRPVLAVPTQCKGLDPRGKVLVTWDGQAEANEAMRAALPLLKRAFGVTLLQINGLEGPLAMDDAVSYLARHGVNCGAFTHSTSGHVADAILERAMAEGAGLVVMGAYSHGRLREAIFGGVTQRILQRSDLPLFLFH